MLFSGWTGVDISKVPLDQDITAEDSKEANKITSIMQAFTTTSAEMPRWTPRVVAEKASIGGLGPVGIGSPATVADEMERWITEADIDGFNIAYVTTPGTFEDLVELLVPELRRRGLYPDKIEDGLTARERVYGKGQSKLRDDHAGSAYKYDVYHEEAPHPDKVKKEAADGQEKVSGKFEEASATAGAAQIELVDKQSSAHQEGSSGLSSGGNSSGQLHETALPRNLFRQWPRP